MAEPEREQAWCGCAEYCGDDGDVDGPGTCKGLRRSPSPPLLRIELADRRLDVAESDEGMALTPERERAFEEGRIEGFQRGLEVRNEQIRTGTLPEGIKHPAEARVEELEKGIGSLLWVINNRHNWAHPDFDGYCEAAEEDARRALRPGGTDG